MFREFRAKSLQKTLLGQKPRPAFKTPVGYEVEGDLFLIILKDGQLWFLLHDVLNVVKVGNGRHAGIVQWRSPFIISHIHWDLYFFHQKLENLQLEGRYPARHVYEVFSKLIAGLEIVTLMLVFPHGSKLFEIPAPESLENINVDFGLFVGFKVESLFDIEGVYAALYLLVLERNC